MGNVNHCMMIPQYPHFKKLSKKWRKYKERKGGSGQNGNRIQSVPSKRKPGFSPCKHCDNLMPKKSLQQQQRRELNQIS